MHGSREEQNQVCLNKNYMPVFFFYPIVQLYLSSLGSGFFEEPLIICAPSRKVLTNALLLQCIWKFSQKKKSMRRKYWKSSDENVATVLCRALRHLRAAASLQWQLMLALLWPRKPSIQSTPRSFSRGALSTLHWSKNYFIYKLLQAQNQNKGKEG